MIRTLARPVRYSALLEIWFYRSDKACLVSTIREFLHSFASLREKFIFSEIFYMRSILFILAVACMVISCSNDQPTPAVSTTEAGKYDINKDSTVSAGEMKRYWLVLLQKGPNRSQDSISAGRIQAAHMADINRLAKEGKLIMAGPIGVEDDLRGIFLMNCADSSEVENFVKTDSAVMTGRLVMKYYPWWTMKGKYIFK